MKTRSNSRAFALPTVLIISIIMLSVLVSAVSSTSSTRVALMNQHYDELSRQAADAGVVYTKACIAADSGKTPRWSDAKPLMPNTDCNGDVTHVCPETSTDPECSVLVTDNNKTITSFTVPKPNPDSKGVYKDIHANGHTKLFRTNGELWRDYTSKSSTPLASLLKVDLPALGTPLADCTWEQIGAIADQGKGDDYWNIGDTKDMTLTTGEVLTMQIYDFNHDDKSDGSGKANITFGTKNLMANNRRMSSTSSNLWGWNTYEIRTWVNETLFIQLPFEIRNQIKDVTKVSTQGYNIMANASTIDKIFLFSTNEVGKADVDTPAAHPYFAEGTLYPIFIEGEYSLANNKRVKKISNGTGVVYGYWLRTANVYANYNLCINSDGSFCNGGPDGALGTAFGFAIGNAPKYNINFNSQGGSGVTTQKIEINKTVTKPTDPTKSGYIFAGWYKDAAYTTAWNFTTDKVTADTTLYAKWVANLPAIGTPLESFTWDQIAYASESGQADTYFDIGDTKNITLSTNEVLTMQIYDFNHDDKSDGSGKAGITFGTRHLMTNPSSQMNTINGNNGGWNSSSMRTWTNSTLFSQFSSDLRSKVKTVRKLAGMGNGSTSGTITSNDRVFLFSDIEIRGSWNSISVSGEGTPYPIFNLNSAYRTKYLNNGNSFAYYYWERSPYSGDYNQFLCINGVGDTQSYNSNDSFGIAFGFAI